METKKQVNKKKERRTADQIIDDLQARITKVKETSLVRETKTALKTEFRTLMSSKEDFYTKLEDFGQLILRFAEKSK